MARALRRDRGMRITPILGITVLALVGCGKDRDGVSPVRPARVSVSMSTGQALTTSMTQAQTSTPAADQLLLHVVRTEVHTASVGWTIISEAVRDVDLRSLSGTVEQIATGTVAFGSLNQIRLVLDGATLVNADGEREVTVPSGDVSGFKLILAPPIEVVSGSTTAVTLTVDGTFEHEAGDKYILRPVVKLSAAP
jgi:hypothetical protein